MSEGAHLPVQSGVSCLRCHELSGGKAGMQPFLDITPTIPSLVAKREDAERLENTHDSDRNQDLMDFGALAYAKFTVRATAGMVHDGDLVRSMTTAEATRALVRTYERYIGPVTVEMVAYELDTDKGTAANLLQASPDPAAIAIINGQFPSRETWQAGGFQSVAVQAVER